MAGSKASGILAAETNKKKYGQNYYAIIGAKGGKKGSKDGAIKGFAAATPEQRIARGAKGGRISRRGKSE